MTAGANLRALRERLGYTIRDVEAATSRLAEKYKNPEFVIQLSRLSDIETKGIMPSIYRLYALAVVYRHDLRELLRWYGIHLESFAEDTDIAEPPRSHRALGLTSGDALRMPIKMDPGFDLAKTTNVGRMIEKWGIVPLTFLQQLADSDYTYGYVGSQDLTMYPLLMPGSFVQVDEGLNRVTTGPWQSEYERPIYFVETRNGFRCSWCGIEGDKLILQPHPLSPHKLEFLRHPQEAEIVGQVVAVAMRLGQWRTVYPSRPKSIREQN